MRPVQNQHWVCFVCRKQTRRTLPNQLFGRPKGKEAEAFLCSKCQTPMVNMGHLFCPPRRHDRRAWEQIRLMAEHGIRFNWGMDVLIWGWEGVSQRSIRATKRRLATCSCHTTTEGQRLLQKIARKK